MRAVEGSALRVVATERVDMMTVGEVLASIVPSRTMQRHASIVAPQRSSRRIVREVRPGTRRTVAGTGTNDTVAPSSERRSSLNLAAKQERLDAKRERLAVRFVVTRASRGDADQRRAVEGV